MEPSFPISPILASASPILGDSQFQAELFQPPDVFVARFEHEVVGHGVAAMRRSASGTALLFSSAFGKENSKLR